MKTDADLRHDIAAELRRVRTIDASRIAVDVLEGVAVLIGTLCDGAQRWAAEQAAGRVDGVRVLVSRLKVALPQDQLSSDESLAKAVERALRWVSSLPGVALRARVEAGWIVLSGEVTWGYQRQAAADVVCRLAGVAGVNNQVGLSRARPSSSHPAR